MLNKLYPETGILKEKKLFLFTCGFWGRIILNVWRNLNWVNFVDNDNKKWGTYIDGLKVISPDELLKKLDDGYICISSRPYNKEIKEQLLSCGISEKQIINIGDITDKIYNTQYFELPELSHTDNEVFVDVGCCDGATSLNFVNWWHEKYSQIYAFETDPININKIKGNFTKANIWDKATLIPKGVWNCETDLKFNSLGNGNSALTDLGTVTVPLTKIDNELSKKKITYMKMDIEGAELNALKGAKKVICEQKPKLAICVYHKREDIFDIPNLLMEYNSDYKFYLRHYSWVDIEIVLYAL